MHAPAIGNITLEEKWHLNQNKLIWYELSFTFIFQKLHISITALKIRKKAYTFVDLKLHGSISRRQIAENETYEIRLCCTNSTITEKIVQHNIKIPQRGKCNIMRLWLDYFYFEKFRKYFFI